jgi:hypothetical protein
MFAARHSIAGLLLAVALLSVSALASAQDKPAADKPAAKLQASAIQVVMVQSDEVKLPIAFQLSLYENVIKQIEKTNKFQHVYRDGDAAAASAANLVVLHTNVYGFKQGSEEKRQVTTVSGKTEIKVHCSFTDKDGKSELAQDVTGQVRFIGGNLRATLDFGKKVANIVNTNFQ